MSAIAQWLEYGGDYFIKWVKENYLTHTGEPLRLSEPFFLEYLRIFGNPWIEVLDVEKAAQIGFTESLIAITAFCLAKLKIPAAMGFEADKKLNQIVSERIQPSFALSPSIQKINQDFQKKIRRQDKDNHQAISVGGVVANFFHGKPNASAKDSGGRQASSSLSSFPTCFMSLDEIALWEGVNIRFVQRGATSHKKSRKRL